MWLQSENKMFIHVTHNRILASYADNTGVRDFSLFESSSSFTPDSSMGDTYAMQIGRVGAGWPTDERGNNEKIIQFCIVIDKQ